MASFALALFIARRAVPDAAAVAVPVDVVRIRWMYEAVRGVAVDVEARAHFVERYQGQRPYPCAARVVEFVFVQCRLPEAGPDGQSRVQEHPTAKTPRPFDILRVHELKGQWRPRPRLAEAREPVTGPAGRERRHVVGIFPVPKAVRARVSYAHLAADAERE